MTKPQLHLMPTIHPTLVLLDGPGRMGKFMAATMIGSLKAVDHPIDLPHFENLTFVARSGLIDPDTAAALLRVTFNHCIYEQIICRHVNTRPDEFSSINKSLDYHGLMARMCQPDGREAVDRYIAEGRMPFLTTVDSLIDIDLFTKAYPGLKAIVVTRHPVDVVESWTRNGIGERCGNDPLVGTPSYRGTKEPVPWWAMSWADEYAEMTVVDRCIRGLLYVMARYEETFDNLDPGLRQDVHRYTFEDMVTDPKGELQKIADFLGTELHPDMSIIMARERLPRELALEARLDHLRALEANASSDLFAQLVVAAVAYEAKWNQESAAA